MQRMMIGLSAVVSIAWLVIVFRSLRDLLRQRWLPLATETLAKPPFISVVVAARNEGKQIGDTVTSLRAQTYNNFEVILVDDRSEDDTGHQMDRLATQDTLFRVIHVRHLPSGWLGKNHALYTGAKRATGEWLLFTDGDVHFEPTALERIALYVTDHDVDHIAVPPRMIARGLWLRAFIVFFMFNIMIYFRPQRADRPSSSAHVGIGAFNMLKTSVYWAIGGHEAFPMRTDDDLHLGKLVKKYGFLQRYLPAANFVQVEWYQSISEMVEGLEKNALSPFGYSVSLLFLSLIPFVILYEAPWIGLFVPSLGVRVLSGISLVMMYLLYRLSIRGFTDMAPAPFVLFPAAALLFIYAFGRSGFIAAWRGGVKWRGTFYTLKALRKRR